MIPSVFGGVEVPEFGLGFGQPPTAQDWSIGEFNGYSTVYPTKGYQIGDVVAEPGNLSDATRYAGVVTGIDVNRNITESTYAGSSRAMSLARTRESYPGWTRALET